MLTDVTQDMLVMREETFGPVVPVMKVSGEDEAVRLANDSEYGLSATVWCESHTRGRDVARRLEAGAVNVNDMFINLFALVLPMGGWKASGMGERLGGDEAIRKYCRDQARDRVADDPGVRAVLVPVLDGQVGDRRGRGADGVGARAAAAAAVLTGPPLWHSPDPAPARCGRSTP